MAQLFDQIQRNNKHLLFNLLPPPSTSSQNYNLRTRSHIQNLPQRTGHLTLTFYKQESLADADKPARRGSMRKIAPIRRVSFYFTEFHFAEFQITDA